MKKLLKFVIVLVILAGLAGGGLYVYESKFLPQDDFKDRTERFAKYVTKVDEKSTSKVHERLEMTPEEYRRMKRQLEDDRWETARNITPDEKLFAKEELEGTYETMCSKGCRILPIPISFVPHTVTEQLTAIVNAERDVVYLEYTSTVPPAVRLRNSTRHS